MFERTNQLVVTVKNESVLPLMVLSCRSTLTPLTKDGAPKARPVVQTPSRIIQTVPAEKSLRVAFQPRPELEPGRYLFDVSLEVVPQKVKLTIDCCA